MDKIVLGRIVAVLLLIALVFTGIATVAPSLDQSNMIFAFITNFFSIGTVLLVVGIVRNVSGFGLEWFRSNCGETYSDRKLYTTLMYYVGLVPTVVAAGSTLPINIGGYSIGEIAGFILIFVDILKQALVMLFYKN